MEKEFVTYEIAKRLQELGLNMECLGYFNYEKKLKYGLQVSDNVFLLSNKGKTKNACLAPLWQQAIDWLNNELKNGRAYTKVAYNSDKTVLEQNFLRELSFLPIKP